jgi:endonuclease/exonuclease/phosphatase family metal-dependent hydrolase
MRGLAPRSRLRIGRVVVAPFEAVAWLLVPGMALVALLYRLAGDTTWWGTVLIYTGRWPWLMLPLALVPVALIWRRRLLVPIVVAILLILGPVVGGTLSPRSLFPVGDQPLRVLTYNVERGVAVSPRLKELLDEYQPDIAGFQECGTVLREALAKLEGWAVVDTGVTSQCLLSRYPMVGSRAIMPAVVFQDAGGAAVAVRHVIATPRGPLAVFNVHLETPRHGVEFLLSDPVKAPRKIRANTLLRETESRVVRRWVDSTSGPKLVLGDFNLPVESAIYRHYWGNLEEVWLAAGNGFGFTRLNGWITVRIDHILATKELKAVRSEVGQDYGSDHLPLIGVYTWR